MIKLYTQKALRFKAIYCACLPLLQILLSAADNGESENTAICLLLSFVLFGCLYTIPFWRTWYAIRRCRETKVGRYIRKDLLSCFAPACGMALLYEIGYFVFADASLQVGLYTVLIFLILLLISGIFWGLYLLAGHHNRP